MPGPPDKIVVLKRTDSSNTQAWADALSKLYDDAAKNSQPVTFLFNGMAPFNDEYAFRVGSYKSAK